MMKCHIKALRDRYLPALIALLLFSVCAQAQWQPINAYGYEWNRGRFKTSLGVPADTATLDATAKQYPQLAIKSGVMYRWDVATQKWVQAATGGSGGVADTLYLYSIIEQYTRDSVFTFHDSLIITKDSVFIYNTTRDTTYFVGTVDPALYNKVDSVTFGQSQYADTVKYWVNGTANNAGIIYKPRGCEDSEGGLVIKTDSLTLYVSAWPFFCVNGKEYTFAGGSVTIAIGDADNPRYDAVVVDTLGNAVVVQGTPSATPAQPQIDPFSQRLRTYIFIPAGSREIPGVTNTKVYDENLGQPDEADASYTGATVVNFNNTTQASSGTKSASIPSNGLAMKRFKFNTPKKVTDFSTIFFDIRLGAKLKANQNTRVQLSLNGAVSSEIVNAAINKDLINAWQQGSVSFQQLFPSTATFDEVLVYVQNASATTYIDNITLQAGMVTQPPVNSGPTGWKPTDGTNTATVAGGGTLQFESGNDRATVTVVPGTPPKVVISVTRTSVPSVDSVDGLRDVLAGFVTDVYRRDDTLWKVIDSVEYMVDTVIKVYYASKQFAGNGETPADSLHIFADTATGTAPNMLSMLPDGSFKKYAVPSGGGGGDTSDLHYYQFIEQLTDTSFRMYRGDGTYDNVAFSFGSSFAPQDANKVFAGPASGTPATPAFRHLLSDDIPSLDAAKIGSGILAPARLASGTLTEGYVPTVQFGGTVAWALPAGGSTGWSTAGNTLTAAGTEFVGSLNAYPLRFRTNNTEVGQFDAAGRFYLKYGTNAVYILAGTGTPTANAGAIAIGAVNGTPQANSTTIGLQAVTSGGSGGTAIGYQANSSGGGIALGYQPTSSGANGAMAIGETVLSSGSSAVAIGVLTRATGAQSIAIGRADSALADASIAIGHVSKVGSGHTYSISLGNAARTTAARQFVVGGRDSYITDVYFGSGPASDTYTNQVGRDYTINGSGANGTNQVGGHLNLAGGKGTGTGTPGDIIFRTATAGASGTTLQSLTPRLTIKGETGQLILSSVSSLPTYADEAAATTAGLASGTFYKSADGIVRIKL